MPNNKINPVNIADRALNITSKAMILGNFIRYLNHLIVGATIKYKNIENTKGTKIVFIEYNAKVIPIAHNVIKLAGIMLSLIGVIS